MSTGPPPPTPGAGQPGGSYAGQPPPAGGAAAGGPAPAPPQNPPPSAQNLNQIVSILCLIIIICRILPVNRGEGPKASFGCSLNHRLVNGVLCERSISQDILRTQNLPQSDTTETNRRDQGPNLSTLELAAQNLRIPTSTFHPFSLSQIHPPLLATACRPISLAQPF